MRTKPSQNSHRLTMTAVAAMTIDDRGNLQIVPR
jgi:hypothetical protein